MFIPTTSSFVTSNIIAPILVPKDTTNTPTSSILHEKEVIAIAPRAPAPTPTQVSSGELPAVAVPTQDSGSILQDQTTAPPEGTPSAKASTVAIVVPIVLALILFAGLAMVFWRMKKHPSSWRRTDTSAPTANTTDAAAAAAAAENSANENRGEQRAATATKSVRSSFSSTTSTVVVPAASAKKGDVKKSKQMPSGGIDMTGGRDSSYSGGRGVM